MILVIDPVNNRVRKDMALGDEKHFYYYPALTFDKNNTVLISYSRSSSQEYTGGFFTITPPQSVLPKSSIELRGNNYFARDNDTGESRCGDQSGA